MIGIKAVTQQGFSIVQGMVLAGVLAGTSLVATRLLSDQKLSQRNAESRDQIEQLHQVIYGVLQNKDHCGATFSPLGTFSTVVSNAQLLQVKTSTGLTIVKISDGSIDGGANAYMNGNVRIKDMRVNYLNDSTGKATLTINYQRQVAKEGSRTKSGYGAKDIAKNIVVRLQRTTAGIFSGCYATTDTDSAGTLEKGNTNLNKEMCESLNASVDDPTAAGLFVWDEANSSCRPRHLECNDPVANAFQINTGINSNGQMECRNITEWINYTDVFDTTSTCTSGNANFKFQVIGTGANQKVQIICD